MKSEELRIGNYVSIHDIELIFVTCNNEEDRIDVDMVNEINSTHIEIFNDGNYHSASFFASFPIDRLKPIPLTKDWLLHLGFEKAINRPEYEHMQTWRNGLFYINESKIEANRYWLSDIQQSCEFIKHVHQLQNLYYALTSKELELRYDD